MKRSSRRRVSAAEQERLAGLQTDIDALDDLSVSFSYKDGIDPDGRLAMILSKRDGLPDERVVLINGLGTHRSVEFVTELLDRFKVLLSR